MDDRGEHNMNHNSNNNNSEELVKGGYCEKSLDKNKMNNNINCCIYHDAHAIKKPVIY